MLRDSNITGIPEHEPSGMQVGVTVDSRIPGVTILECRAPIFISVCQSRNRGSSIQNARRLNKPGSVVARDLLARCQDALGDWACDSVIALPRRTALAAARREVYRRSFASVSTASCRCVSQLIWQAFEACASSRISASPLMDDACRWTVAGQSARLVRANALAANHKPQTC